jgi:ABC-type lipoprotein release transport system permease subunit
VQTWDSRREQIESNLGLIRLVIQIISAAALLAAVFIVLNTLSINLVERIGMFGMLRCLGMTRGQIAGVVFAEAFLFGAAGLIAGIPLGLLCWRIVLAAFPEFLSSAEMSWTGIGLAVLGSLGGTAAAAVWPALRAAAVSPNAAVRVAAGEGRRPFQRIGWIVGAGCLALEAALLWGIPHPGVKVYIHLTIGLPLIFLGYFLLSPGIVRALGPAAAWISATVGRATAAVAALLRLRRRAQPAPDALVGEVRRHEGTLAPAICALMVGAGFVTAITINSRGLSTKLRSTLPAGFPEVYAVGMGSYSEELAYRYYLTHTAEVKAARENPFADPESVRLAELVQFPAEERDWQPFVRAWRELNGLAQGDPAGLAEIYVQEVEMNRPPVAGLDGLLPRDVVMVSVDPTVVFEVLPMKIVKGDPATIRRRLLEGGGALIAHSFLSSRPVELGYKFDVNLEGDPGRPSKTFEVVGVAELGLLEVLFMYLDPTAGPDSLTHGVFLTGSRDAVAAIDARGLRDQAVRYKSRGSLRQSKVMVGNLSPAAPPDATTRLREASRNLVIDSARQLIDDLVAQLDRIVAIFSAVGWVTLAVAGLGTANVRFMKILRRRRELGILRALGMTRTQAAELVLTEAAVVGLLGGLMGIALGLHLALAGRHLDWILFGVGYNIHFPFGFAAATVGASVLVCLLAAVVPARRAAEMKISTALARAV